MPPATGGSDHRLNQVPPAANTRPTCRRARRAAKTRPFALGRQAPAWVRAARCGGRPPASGGGPPPSRSGGGGIDLPALEHRVPALEDLVRLQVEHDLVVVDAHLLGGPLHEGLVRHHLGLPLYGSFESQPTAFRAPRG